MYTVPGNCMPLGWQTTERSPGRTWQAWGGSFLLLPRRHALSSRWLWTFNHNTRENCLEEVQGSASSPLFTPPLFQNTWPCVQLLCVEPNAPCQWDLAIDKAKPPASAAKWQGNDQTDLQCQAARHCHHQVQWSTCAAWHWGSGPHSEGEKTSMVWTCGMNAPVVQSRQPLTYRLMESVGLGGPKWHGSSWQRGIAESGSSQLSTLMIDVPGDLVWDLPCVQQASYLEGGPLMWMLPLNLHVNQNPIMIWWYEVVDKNSHTEWQTVQIQISWLLQKPTDLELHCLQRQGISTFSRTTVNVFPKILFWQQANKCYLSTILKLACWVNDTLNNFAYFSQ